MMTDLPVLAAPCAAVTFVGAARHLTPGACHALPRAVGMIHDRLAGPEVLARVPAHVRVLDRGKAGFGPPTPQSRINPTPVECVSRPDQRIVPAALAGPAVILYGPSPRRAAAALPHLKEARA